MRVAFLPVLFFIAFLAAPAAAAPDPGTSPPLLASKLTADDVAKFYPPLAHMYDIRGQAIITCGVRPDGRGHDCKAQGETPPGLGFGRAAEKLASTFRFSPGMANGVAAERPWTGRIAFQPDAADEADAPSSTESPPAETLKLAERFVDAEGFVPIFDTAAAGVAGKRDCASNGGAYCDQFGKAVEGATAEESARLHTALIAWVATTYTESELKVLVSTPGARDPGLIEKGGQLALALPELELRAARDHHQLVRKYYCEVIGCPTPIASPPAATPR